MKKYMAFLFFIILILFTAGCPLSPKDEGTAPDEGEAGTWYVDAGAPPGGDGKTWASAFQHPQDAVNAAQSGEVVKVAQGAYYPRAEEMDRPVLRMKDGVDLYGGYNLDGGAVIARDTGTYPSYLSGVWYDEDETQVIRSVHIVVGASDARLDGFFITDGNTCVNPDDPTLYSGPLEDVSYWGGGMLNDHVEDLWINDCFFSSNRAEAGGGAVCNDLSDVDITKCQFWFNVVWREIEEGMDNECYGGAIAVRDGGLLRVENSLFVSNTAGTILDLEGCGGSIAGLPAANVRILHCTFANSAADDGLCLYDAPEEPGHDPGSISITASILWSQSMGQGDCQIESEIALQAAYSDICIYDSEEIYEGTGNINEDPLFAGGLYIDLEYFRLTLASPCFNAVPAGVSTFDDLEGSVRNGADGWVQMGALENL